MRHEMCVILGAASVKAYVASPKKYEVIGIVRFGQEYGLLATDLSGQFFRVNDSQAIALHAGSVQQAIAVAREAGSHNFQKYKTVAPLARAVPITIRKHRHFVHDPAAAH